MAINWFSFYGSGLDVFKFFLLKLFIKFANEFFLSWIELPLDYFVSLESRTLKPIFPFSMSCSIFSSPLMLVWNAVTFWLPVSVYDTYWYSLFIRSEFIFGSMFPLITLDAMYWFMQEPLWPNIVDLTVCSVWWYEFFDKVSSLSCWGVWFSLKNLLLYILTLCYKLIILSCFRSVPHCMTFETSSTSPSL